MNGVHFTQEETSHKTFGGHEYQKDAPEEELLILYGHQTRPQFSERGNFLFQDDRGGIPYGSNVAVDFDVQNREGYLVV